MSSVSIEKIAYGGWENCLRVSNRLVEIVATTDIGPRIIRYGFVGQPNEFCEVDHDRGRTGGEEWRMYGGHRLWHSPENNPRTYQPDNYPVEWQEIAGGVSLGQEVEVLTGIQKEIEVTLAEDGTTVSLLHRLSNQGSWPVELAVWAITVMAPGGREVIPQTRKGSGLIPDRLISLWPYTSLNDPRVKWGDRYIIIDQNSSVAEAFKIGLSNPAGWAAYCNRGRLFLKRYHHQSRAQYPDYGVSYETYTNDFMLEMETLSPLTNIEPGESIEHREEWALYDNIPMPQDAESGIDAVIRAALHDEKKTD
jgi:hypothetical protein